MATTFHEPEIIDNLREIFNNTCKKISEKDNITEYLCPCGYIISESEEAALKVRSIVCGF